MSNRSRAKRRRQASLARAEEKAAQAGSPTTILAAGYSASITHKAHSGPIPSPEQLAEYDAVSPGLADKIIDTWQRQNEHRMTMEKEVIRSDKARSWAGLFMGGLVSLAAFGVAGFAIQSGYTGSAVTIALADMGSLAGAFIYGTRSQRVERIDRAKLLRGKK